MEHGAEDVRVDLAPVELPCCEHLLPEIPRQRRKRNLFLVHAVDAAEVLVLTTRVLSLGLPRSTGGLRQVQLFITQHLKQFGELGVEIVCRGVVEHPLLEGVFWPHLGVVTEKEKQQPNQK